MEKKKPDITIKLNKQEEMKVQDWRSANGEIAASEEAVPLKDDGVREEDEFTWVLPDEEEIPEYRKIHYVNDAPITPGKKKVSSSWSWIPFLFAFSLAIGLGLLFGYGLIWLASSDEQTAAPAIQQQPNTTVTEEPSAASGGGAVTLEPLTMAIIQAGVFTEEGAATVFQEQLTAKGISSKALTLQNNTAIIVGMSESVESAKVMSGFFEGIEVFAKPIELPASNWEGLSETETSFVKGLMPVVKEVSEWAAITVPAEKAAEISKVVSELSSMEGIKNESLVSVQGELKKLSTIIQKDPHSSKSQAPIMDIVAILHKL
ncbi:hypothetical protein [Mangrovibacillus cuniculi]|uniref:SPOR domain-containing protein n=1 Tax=Mangrovibacillus cuniculi TaxID=2593652 RepID=A0A7S8CC30_9BACI|nr:hypothetical protein [Mangrovibacillus cuniculi]QPC47053.1 hypothetical protein G8O30_08780 [Mangrovibacillus cuniculi]